MKVSILCLAAALLGTAVAWGQVDSVPRIRTEIGDGMEVLTRGPVHEAFAETVTFDPEPGIVTPKMPPEPKPQTPDEKLDDHRPRPSSDINVGNGDGLDVNIGGDKADPEAGAIDVEVGGGKGVRVDAQPKTEPK